MNPNIRFTLWFLILFMSSSACSSPASTATHAPVISPTETTTSAVTLAQAVPPTETTSPTETSTPEPSVSPTVAFLDLEIVEWYEHAIPNLVDPLITDTNIEILVRNPNDLPVDVNTEELEFRLINEAGEVVYTNRSAYFSLWEGSWMLAGDSSGFQICACFDSSGQEKQDWESIQLIAPIEPAIDVFFTRDVEVILGEPFSLADAHLGGSGTGIPITLTNSSDLALESIPMRVIARDADGQYIGMAAFGNSVVSFTEDISIQPGDSLEGILDSEIDYFNEPLTYEVVAIGIPASLAATEEIVLPSGTPLADWESIPIMQGAISGEAAVDNIYQFTIQATVDEITSFYEMELANLGYQLEMTDDQEGYTSLYFSNEMMTVVVVIAPLGGLTGVVITLSS